MIDSSDSSATLFPHRICSLHFAVSGSESLPLVTFILKRYWPNAQTGALNLFPSNFPFLLFIDHVAVKSAGANPAKAGPGRGVQYNAHFTSKTRVTLNDRKNCIPSQIYSSTSCNYLPNWPDSPESDASQDCQVSIWRSRLQFHEFQLILLLLPHV